MEGGDQGRDGTKVKREAMEVVQDVSVLCKDEDNNNDNDNNKPCINMAVMD